MSNPKKTEKSVFPLKVDWGMLCKSATVDQVSNQISLFNVIDEVTLVKNPQLESAIRDNKKIEVKLESALVVQFERENVGDMSAYSIFMEIRIIDPLKAELGKLSMPFEMQQDKKRARAIINFNNLLITQAGNYSFIVSLRYPKEDSFFEVLRIPLEVKII